MNKILFLVLLVFTSVVSFVGFSIKEFLNIEIGDVEFFSIPLFLMLYQLVVIVFLPLYFKKNYEKAVVFMSMSKLAKVICSIAFILGWFWFEGFNNTFLMTFLCFYLVYIFYDSWMFMHCNKVHVQKQKSNETK